MTLKRDIDDDMSWCKAKEEAGGHLTGWTFVSPGTNFERGIWVVATVFGGQNQMKSEMMTGQTRRSSGRIA